MKKTLGLLLVAVCVLGLVSVSLAQTPKPTPVQHKMFAGTVDSVTVGDAAKATKSAIVVIDKQNVSKTFVVTPTTKIVDVKGVALTLDKIQKGQEVSVRYKTVEKGEIALGIKVTK